MIQHLEKDWLTQGLIDFEYKKYQLFSYLQYVKSDFDNHRLYPPLKDIIFHYQNLLDIKENKKLLFEQFPKEFSKADFEKLQIVYQDIVNDDAMMTELADIIEFALPYFKTHLEKGKEIYDYIESNLEINSIGVSPIYKDAGYLFLEEKQTKEFNIYQYQITFFEKSDEKFRGINTQLMGTFHRSIANTFESVKLELVKKYKHLPNPATFLVATGVVVPLNETLLPIAKRLLVKYIGSS